MRLFALIVLLFGCAIGAGNDAHQIRGEFGSRSEGVTVGMEGSGGLELERGARSMGGGDGSTSKKCAKAGSECRGHPTVGLCEKLIIGYTFDSVSQKCLRFKAGGCSLSKNGFKSEEECTNQCHRIPYGGTCRAMPGSSVSDSWCKSHCQGGKHPACMNSSRVHQLCICDDTCTMEKIMRKSGRFSNEGVTVGLQLGLTPPENCEDESIVMKRCDKLNNTFYKNFRTLEGQCNNEEHPLLGSTRSRLSRLLLADHEKFRKQTFFDKPQDLEYTKLDKKHCYPDRYGNYSTILSAKIACLSDGNCQGVYDNGCNGKASGIHLCPTSATYSNSFGSCIYQKTGNGCPEDDCNNACQKESDLLPNPRKLSTQVTDDIDRQDASLSLMAVIFGQFLDHELALSPEHEVEESCCEVPANGKTKDEECFEILIPPDDPFYSRLNQSCIHLTRSDPHSSSGWPPSIKREQQNIVTSFLDGSHVYGSTTGRSKRLRSMVKGKLKVQNEYNLLPEENFRRCRVPIAGDERAMENPMLGSIHVLFVREHNRICDQLWKMIDWTQYGYSECDNDKCDELLYQNARRVLIAEWQSIIYNEWLPLILGGRRMSEFNLNLDSNSSYNNTIDPSILVSFATAAFRFGHSMVSGNFVKNSIASGKTVEQIVLSDSFFNADEYRKNGMEMTLAGLLTERAQRMDRFVSKELTNFLFKDTDGPSKPRFGQDLISRNIARGRDHGLPGYAKFYETFGPQSDPGRFMKCWDERPLAFDSLEWNLMKEIYIHPKDIDLFVGGLLEKRMPNEGVLGPMFGYIVAEQFRRLKDGDRFFFTHKGNEHSFSSNFINSIKRRRLSDLLCDNTSIRKVNKNAFLSTSDTMDCRQTNRLDFIHSNLLLPPTSAVCSGPPIGYDRLWSTNVETVLKYKSKDLTSMIQNDKQLDQLNVPSPMTMEADVEVQSFRDETLRVKFEHIKFYSQNEEVSVSNAHRVLDMISSQNGNGRHGVHTFKTSLEQPMMILAKHGRAKDILVSKNEPDCVSKIKVMLVKALMQNVENQELKIVKKESIVKPFEIASSTKKINLSLE